MAIEFMVIAAPRSGTTWAANWLTTDTTLCLHDPIFNYHYSELDNVASKHKLGISCTGLMYFPEWLNNHPARKVVLHRDNQEIRDSIAKLGFPPTDEDYSETLNVIDGQHYAWSDIFDNPKPIYEYLLDKEFDAERHSELKKVWMEPNFNQVNPTAGALHRIFDELRG
jgi:hypothetical protein